MPRRRAIATLGAELARAAAGRDWDALSAASGALAREVPRLAAQGVWSAPETAALKQLRAQHFEAFERCSEAHAELGSRLADLQANKAGWIAYALAGETGPEWTHA